MKTKDLLWSDLDAKWTPEGQFGRFGLPWDSTVWPAVSPEGVWDSQLEGAMAREHRRIRHNAHSITSCASYDRTFLRSQRADWPNSPPAQDHRR